MAADQAQKPTRPLGVPVQHCRVRKSTETIVVDMVETCGSAQVKRVLQRMKVMANHCLDMVGAVFCRPSTGEQCEDVTHIQVLTIINISDSTLNNCRFQNQKCSCTGSELLQMQCESGGESRSYHIVNSELNYAMFGDHNVMTVDLDSNVEKQDGSDMETAAIV